LLYVRDLEGTEYPFQATIDQEYELNGNQSLSATINPSKANNLYIRDISEMWEVVDFDDVVHKVIYAKRKGQGDELTVDIKAIPLFFDDFDNSRIYEEFNEHMTAQVAFGRIFKGTGYDFIIHDSLFAVNWEGFGAGETRLETFKRALERYKAEFEIIGNTIHLKSLVGRDTQFQYRYKLNASNIVQEIDASEFWTYARGYGDYGDGDGGEDWQDAKLTREYTSPLAKITQIGVRHAPPIKNGNITDVETMDKDLKTLVDESLKISVSADIYDLRNQGYALAQPQKGDRVFLIDERIDFDQEVRVVDMNIQKNWLGKILHFEITIGNAGLTKRHQSNIQTAIDNITDVISGNKKLPYNVLDNAVLRATESLRSAQTELLFDNGIIAREKDDPNRLVLYNSKGLGISDDGGGTFKEAITADGFVLSAGAIGRLSANHIQIGPETDFEDGYNPTEIKSDLDEFEDYVGDAFKDGIIEEAEAKAIEKYLNSLSAEKETITAQVNYILSSDYKEPILDLLFESVFDSEYLTSYDNLVQSINAAIAGGKTSSAEKAEVDTMFADYRDKVAEVLRVLGFANERIAANRVKEADDKIRDNLNITAPLPTSISLNHDGITASTSVPNRYARLDYRGLYIAGGAIQIDDGLPDNQIKGSSKWNKQGTYIDKDGIYTGKVTANQVSSGVIDTNRIKVQGGSGDNYTKIDGNFFENKGRHRRHWWDYNAINTVRVMIEDGQIRARNDTQNWSLYFNDWGISTFADGSGDDYGQVASGAIEFHSTKYHESRGLTIFSGARLALETNGGRLYLNPNGANVHVANEYDNYYNITAGGYNNSSSKKEKRGIKLLQDDALSLINSLKIMEYKRLTGGKSTTLDRWQAGIIVEEAPHQLLANGESVDIYTYVNYLARSVQQLSDEVTELKGA